uniref:Large ribosomal subunit protein mL50 n=1 Tax=Bionectria ochroleuca TaxID=29856 RepID=A0A8H7TSI9_BIOOC
MAPASSPKRTEATTEKEMAANDPTYTPALTIEELEEIPPFSKWWDQPEHWGKESEFRSFGKAEKEVERAIIEVQVRRAVVEVLSLQQENKLAEQLVKKWPAGSREALEQTLAVEIVGADGQFSLQGDVSSVVSHLTQDAAGSSEEGSPSITLEEAAEITNKWDAKWKEIKVNDEIKFAIRKRIYQLTGNLIPDSKLGAARNVRDVLTTLFQQRKPSSLADELLAKPEVTKLPNVRVHSRKVGPIDKEIEIGRWKVIEEELKKRDLPVTGTDNLSGNKEREWMTGKA